MLLPQAIKYFTIYAFTALNFIWWLVETICSERNQEQVLQSNKDIFFPGTAYTITNARVSNEAVVEEP